MRTLVLTTALCILAGCGTAPPESAPAAPSAALAAKPAPQAAVPRAGTVASEKREFKPPAGYKTKLVGGAIVYCQKTVVLGSHFPREVCMNEAQLKEHLVTNDKMRQDLDKATRTCSQAAGCGGL